MAISELEQIKNELCDITEIKEDDDIIETVTVSEEIYLSDFHEEPSDFQDPIYGAEDPFPFDILSFKEGELTNDEPKDSQQLDEDEHISLASLRENIVNRNSEKLRKNKKEAAYSSASGENEANQKKVKMKVADSSDETEASLLIPKAGSKSRKNSSSGEKHFKCSKCDKRFMHKGSLETHCKMTHSNDKPHVCTVCKKGFPFRSHLKRHKRIHDGIKPYQCDICSKAFTFMCNMSEHRRTHLHGKDFSCDRCNKRFKWEASFEKHKAIHETNDVKSEAYICVSCNKSFVSAGSLCAHHKLVHVGKRPYVCETCSKCFTTAYHLKRHNIIHTGESLFHCDVCNKGFIQKTTMIIHKRVHSGEKPHKCDACGKEYSQKGDLTRHKRQHTGEVERAYECGVCHKLFIEKRHFIAHRQVHSGGLYRCNVCKKCFANPDDMIKHKRSHTTGASDDAVESAAGDDVIVLD